MSAGESLLRNKLTFCAKMWLEACKVGYPFAFSDTDWFYHRRVRIGCRYCELRVQVRKTRLSWNPLTWFGQWEQVGRVVIAFEESAENQTSFHAGMTSGPWDYDVINLAESIAFSMRRRISELTRPKVSPLIDDWEKQ